MKFEENARESVLSSLCWLKGCKINDYYKNWQFSYKSA